MTRPRFDVSTEACIGVRWADRDAKRPVRLGLRDLLVHAHEIEGIGVTPPPAQSALYRLLYAITSRIAHLDEDEYEGQEWWDRWEEIRERGLAAEDVDAYFDEFAGRFDLFDENRPFLQDPRLADPAVCPKSSGVNKLAIGRPAGNNAVWFGHHWDASPVPLKPDEAFADLLVWLYYGPSGRCATRVHEGVSAADVSAGPLRSSLSYHLEGDTLLDTLLAGLVPPDPDVRRDEDLCPWERPDLPDPVAQVSAGASAYAGPRSRLTGGWQHALLLVPDEAGQEVVDAFITWGRRGKQPSTNDSYVMIQLSQQGNLYARYAKADRALWRDLDGLLQLSTGTESGPRPPEVLRTFRVMDFFKVRALGFDQDGKTKDVQFVTAVTPPLLVKIGEREPAKADRIGKLRTAGEMFGHRLDYAAKRAWALLTETKIADCAWNEHAAAIYWPEAEELFWALHRKIMDGEDIEDPWRPFLALALRAFNEVTWSHVRDARSARAVEQARLELFGRAKTKRSA
ncbi:type I-E CRISPR-associated protein Cse1/CasA [Actinomadura parmotrematis]|uniref:Type I-E CRISPR-associated protein Cse1/CasA n=1 Tax=Actinomadura parmotrematis TaxID=2864039 RepID=A0ABS7FXM6_9ACTN|nr:type I-E CRISPR-associated protein Cse1/CasA [Actinomadura parmotrematis]MBW8484434.1 type I-E CRISPR-associated protein Cse1/CasA [Actinomadura parmotrematis]